jgi:hypothetical protein
VAWRARIRDLLTDSALRARVCLELARLSPTYGFDAMAEQYLRLIERGAASEPAPLPQAVRSGV